jgi:hypothetical protein
VAKIKSKIIDKENYKNNNNYNEILKDLIVWYTNADGFLNKRSELGLLLQNAKCKPNIIAITEVRPKNLKHNLLNSELNLKGYNMFSVNIEDQTGRGIVIYVDSRLKASQINIPNVFQEFVFVEIKIDNGSENLIIGNIYRSPNSVEENDIKLNELIDYVCKAGSGRILIVGDFNFGQIHWNTNYVTDSDADGIKGTSAAKFLSCIRRNFLQQHINRPTRYRIQQEPHILDLVMTDTDYIDSIEYLSPLGKSDHALLSFNCKLSCSINPNLTKLNYNKGRYDDLRKFLFNVLDKCWMTGILSVSESVNNSWCKLRQEVESGMSNFIPLVSNWKKRGVGCIL